MKSAIDVRLLLKGGRLFQQEMRKNEKSLGKFGSKARSISRGMGRAGAGMTAGLTVPLLYFTHHAIEQTEELSKTQRTFSNALGVTETAAGPLTAVLKTNGIASTAAAMGLKKITTALYKAKSGNKGAVKSFKQLGINWRDLIKMSPEERLHATLAAIQKLPPKMRALGGSLLGKSFQKFGPMMQDGALGIDEQMKMAKKYGAFIGSDGKTSIEDFERSQLEMQYAMMGLQVTLATKVGPTLTKIIDKVTQMTSWWSKLPAPIRNATMYFALGAGPLLVFTSGVMGLILKWKMLTAAETEAGVAGAAAGRTAMAAWAPVLAAAATFAAGYGIGTAAYKKSKTVRDTAGAAWHAVGVGPDPYAVDGKVRESPAAFARRRYGPKVAKAVSDKLRGHHGMTMTPRDVAKLAHEMGKRPIIVKINGREVFKAVEGSARDKAARK